MAIARKWTYKQHGTNSSEATEWLNVRVPFTRVLGYATENAVFNFNSGKRGTVKQAFWWRINAESEASSQCKGEYYCIFDHNHYDPITGAPPTNKYAKTITATQQNISK
jgi:hypothetical protein